jgi:hypothetical protein
VAPPDQIQPLRRQELASAKFQICGLRVSRGTDAWAVGQPRDGFRYRIPYKFIPKTTILNNLSAFVPASKNQQFFYRPHGLRRQANDFTRICACAVTPFNNFAARRPQSNQPSN